MVVVETVTGDRSKVIRIVSTSRKTLQLVSTVCGLFIAEDVFQLAEGGVVEAFPAPLVLPAPPQYPTIALSSSNVHDVLILKT